MITKTEGYKTSDGKVHPSISEAQAHEVHLLYDNPESRPSLPLNEWIVANKDAILAILNPELPKKRTRKPRLTKAATQPALT